MPDSLHGWRRADAENAPLVNALGTPFYLAPRPDTTRTAHNHLYFKRFVGSWYYTGPNRTGDSVSFAWACLLDYTAALDGYMRMVEAIDSGVAAADIPLMARAVKEQFEPAATEILHAWGDPRGPGGVRSAKIAKTVQDRGVVTRAALQHYGFNPEYDPKRADVWANHGLPAPASTACPRDRLVADTTPVLTFDDAAFHVQNYRPVVVCSDVGFATAGDGRTARDKDGFSGPQGTWNRGMCFIGARFGPRPGLLVQDSRAVDSVIGPTGPTELPPCSWWVDADVADKMLAQNDAYTAATERGFPPRRSVRI